MAAPVDREAGALPALELPPRQSGNSPPFSTDLKAAGSKKLLLSTLSTNANYRPHFIHIIRIIHRKTRGIHVRTGVSAPEGYRTFAAVLEEISPGIRIPCWG